MPAYHITAWSHRLWFGLVVTPCPFCPLPASRTQCQCCSRSCLWLSALTVLTLALVPPISPFSLFWWAQCLPSQASLPCSFFSSKASLPNPASPRSLPPSQQYSPAAKPLLSATYTWNPRLAWTLSSCYLSHSTRSEPDRLSGEDMGLDAGYTSWLILNKPYDFYKSWML